MSGLRRFVIRLGKVVAVLVALLVVAHTVATIVTGRPLARELQRLKAAGEPLTLAEAAPKPVPDDENAAVLYQQAFDKMRASLSDNDERVLGDFLGAQSKPRGRSYPPAVYQGGPARPPTPAQVKAILKHNAEVIALVEAAAQRPKCVFPMRWDLSDTAYADMAFPQLSQMKRLTRLLMVKAGLLATEGKADEALAVCRTMLRMSEHLAYEPTLLGQLTRIALQAITRSTVEAVLQTSSPSAAACRTTFDAISKVDDRVGLALALKGERALGLGAFRDPQLWYAKAMMAPGARIPWKVALLLRLYGSYLGRPFLNADEARYLRFMSDVIAQTKQPYPAQARRCFLETGRVAGGGTRSSGAYGLSIWYPVSSMVIPVFDRVPAAAVRMNAGLGLAQVGVAAAGYKAETGAYPESLAQLQRAGWPLRDDPYSGKPFVYHRKGHRFIAYSIGPDLEDNGGVPEALVPPKRPSELFVFKGDIIWRVSR